MGWVSGWGLPEREKSALLLFLKLIAPGMGRCGCQIAVIGVRIKTMASTNAS